MLYQFTFKSLEDYHEAWRYMTKQGFNFTMSETELRIQFQSNDMDEEDQREAHDQLCKLNPAVVRWTQEYDFVDKPS